MSLYRVEIEEVDLSDSLAQYSLAVSAGAQTYCASQLGTVTPAFPVTVQSCTESLEMFLTAQALRVCMYVCTCVCVKIDR